MKKIFYLLILMCICTTAVIACSDGNDDPADGDIENSETDGDSADVDDTDGDGTEEDASDGDMDAVDGDMEEEGGYPPLKCKTPEPLGDGPYFTDVTDQYGIGRDGLAVDGNRMAVVDFNNDGFADMLVHNTGSNVRDDLEADPPKRLKRMLLNVKNPNLPVGRVFEDVTDTYGYTQTRDGQLGRAAHLAVFGDVNNDGRLDIFSGTYIDANNKPTDAGDRSEILTGKLAGGFALAPQSDTTPSKTEFPSTTGASFLDYDLDGNLDLWVGFFYKQYGYLEGLQNRLYKGNGDGTFTDVTDELGLTTFADTFDEGTNHKPSYGVTVCDVNDDGLPDLISSTYGRQFNELWLNNGNGFEDISQSSGFASDENLDYSDNEFYRCYCTVNECDPDPGNPSVQCPSPAGSYWGSTDENEWRLGGNTFVSVCGDWTGDGLPEVFNGEIQHWHIGQSSDPSSLLVNETDENGVLFNRPGRDATGLNQMHLVASWNEGNMSAARFDFDLDGYPDLLMGNSDYPGTFAMLYRQTEDGVFEDVTKAGGANHQRAHGVVAADFDRDGDLDVVIGSSTARESPWETNETHIYRNEVGNKSNAARITLIGKGEGFANRSAIGARVKITTGDRTQTEWIDGGYGHFGLQSELALTVGLGEACSIDTLEIRWPNKDLSVQTFENVPANYHLIIEEGGEIQFEDMLAY